MLANKEEQREITLHEVPGAQTSLKIIVADMPGHGNANHRYEVSGLNTSSNVSELGGSIAEKIVILFQNGTIPDVGVNGLTLEALLAICADRLIGFQSGKFACNDNAEALAHIEQALTLLQKRTRSRIARSVEGKHVA
jgi:hypothetical protein